jgi:hypothetical protein
MGSGTAHRPGYLQPSVTSLATKRRVDDGGLEWKPD